MTRKISARIFSLAIGAVLSVLLCTLPALAAIQSPSETLEFPILSPPSAPTESEPVTPPQPTRQFPTDLQEVEEFVDQFFEREMRQQHIPGSVITIVKNDEVIVSKGYGYANVEENIPVVPDRTLFRVASLSKLFTDTAVMQLYEQGLLDLDADVNQYLQSFQIDNGYPEPVTAAHILTQTEGTTQRLIGIAARSPEQMTPLAEFIPKFMPPFVWPPGELYTYSNLGITLAGYLVQEISGTPFVEYMNENLLQPLQMERSSFQQPLPSPLNSDLALGYQYKGGNFQSVPFLYLNIVPAAALSATATDMAHFLIAHLQNGRYEDDQILEPDTVEVMHEQHFVNFPNLPGSAYGFHERYTNNLRAIGHSGSLRGYSSGLTLVPEEGIGIFIATNSFNNLHEKFLAQFFDHYYPVPQTEPPTVPADFQPQRFTGTYRDIEHPRDTFAKLGAPFGHLHLEANDDGTLTASLPSLFFAGQIQDKQLAPVEEVPRLFQRLDDNKYAAFGTDSDGDIAYLFNPIGPTLGAFKKIPWYETIIFQLGLAIFCILVFLSAAIVWVGGYFRHHSWRRTEKKAARTASLLAGLVSLLYIVFVVGLPLYLWLIGVWKIVYGIPVVAQGFFYLPPVAVALTIPLPIFAVLAWKNKYWSTKARLYYSLITVAALAFIPFLIYWNLLVARFP